MSKRSFILYFDFLYKLFRKKRKTNFTYGHMVNVFFDFPFFFEFGISLVAYSICHYTRIPLPHFNFFRLQLFSKGLGFKNPKFLRRKGNKVKVSRPTEVYS